MCFRAVVSYLPLEAFAVCYGAVVSYLPLEAMPGVLWGFSLLFAPLAPCLV